LRGLNSGVIESHGPMAVEFIPFELGMVNRFADSAIALPAARRSRRRKFHADLNAMRARGLVEAERLAPSGPCQPGKGGANPGQQVHCTPVIIGCNRFYGVMERKNFKFRSNAAILA
jgi:hypothetical protein